MTEKEEKAIEYTKQILKYPKLLADTEKEGNFLREIDKGKIDTVVEALEQRIINQKIYAEEYEKVTKQLNCEVKDNLEKSIALEQKDKEIEDLKEKNRRIGEIYNQLHKTHIQTRKSLKGIINKQNKEIQELKESNKRSSEQILMMSQRHFNDSQKIKELKEKWNKDTHTLQNQLDLANADRVEKDKIIDLMANFMNKRSWKEHQVKDDICYCCKIEYSSEECVRCIKQYFKEKAREENEK